MVDRLLCKMAVVACSVISTFTNRPLLAQATHQTSVDQGSQQSQTASGITCINAFNGQPPQSFQFQAPLTDLTKLKALPQGDPAVIVNAIEQSMGLGQRIGVYPASIGTACATIVQGDQRRVYFGSEWLEKYSNGSYWIKVAILAHEIGHHVNFHALDNTMNAWRKEYEADVFLGRVVRIMGGSLDNALSAVSRVEPAEGDEVHPPRTLRETAIRSGYGVTNSANTTPISQTVSIWNSPGTYCDGLVNLLLKKEGEYKFIKPARRKSTGERVVEEKLFNLSYEPKDQCGVGERNGVCKTHRATLQEFKTAFSQALDEIGTCLSAHNWKEVSTTFVSPDTGLPDTRKYQRIFSPGGYGLIADTQLVTLTRAGKDKGQFDFELQWSFRDE